MRERKEGGERQRAVDGHGVRREGVDRGGRESARLRVGVGVVEATVPPEQIAHVHDVAVEEVDKGPVIGVRVDPGCGIRGWSSGPGGHGRFDAPFVAGQDKADAGDGGQGVVEEEGVDERGRGQLDAHVALELRVGDYARGLLVKVEDGGVGCDGWGCL